MRNWLTFTLVLAASWQTARTTPAAVVGYTLRIKPTGPFDEKFDRTQLRLTNDSDTAGIVGFHITVGDPSAVFDQVMNPEFARDDLPLASFTDLTGIGGNNDGLVADHVGFSFSGFGPGDRFRFRADLDALNQVGSDRKNQQDFRHVLFDVDGSDPSDNSVVTVTFSGGQQLSGQLPDFARTDDDRYSYSESAEAAECVCPEPASVAVWLLLALGVWLTEWRRVQRQF